MLVTFSNLANIFLYPKQLTIRLGMELCRMTPSNSVKGCISRNINYYIHLIFHDQLAARLISRPSKKCVSVGSLRHIFFDGLLMRRAASGS